MDYDIFLLNTPSSPARPSLPFSEKWSVEEEDLEVFLRMSNQKKRKK
uniref:Uncharacterized protein n=1 Tax=Acrobeloides nanus TaxID=290746 RepID=A0A914D9U0_9BILA